MEEYNREVEALARRLVQMMISSLELTREEAKHCTTIRDFGDISAVLQLNWYPSCPDPECAMGLAAHTDSGLLTVLYQSTSSTGLQVLSSEQGKARWVAVPPLPGALVVNIDDLAHILSNGRYRSVVHRAVVNRTNPRMSAAYICGPGADVMVSPVTKLAMYRDVTWPEYRGLKAKHFDKALTSIRIEHDNYDKDDKVLEPEMKVAWEVRENAKNGGLRSAAELEGRTASAGAEKDKLVFGFLYSDVDQWGGAVLFTDKTEDSVAPTGLASDEGLAGHSRRTPQL